MGKMTGFEPGGPIKPGIDALDDAAWSQSEKDILSGLSVKLGQGEHLSPADSPNALVLFSKGIANPSIRPEAIAWLLNPQGANLLKDVFEQTWTPDLGMHVKEELVKIANEPDEKTMIEKLGNLVAEELRKETGTTDTDKTPENIPLTSTGGGLNILFLSGAALRSRTTSEVNTDIDTSQPARSNSPLANIMNAFNSGNDEQLEELLAATHKLETVLGEAGEEAWALLIDLTANPAYRGMAVELLHRQGEKIIPVLEEAGKQNPQAHQVIQWVQTGEWPQYSMAEDTQLSQTLRSGNLEPFRDLIRHTPDSQRLMGQVTARGEQMVPHLIKLLGDTDGKIRVFSMEALHQLGDEAVEDLRIAKADSNPEISKNAASLLRYHFTGELAPETGREVKANPFQQSPFDSAAGSRGKGAPGGPLSFTPDIDYLKKQLSNPGTSMETLSALKQVGRPAVPVMCRLLQKSTRK